MINYIRLCCERCGMVVNFSSVTDARHSGWFVNNRMPLTLCKHCNKVIDRKEKWKCASTDYKINRGRKALYSIGMSKENDRYFRAGVMRGFRAGFYAARREMEAAIASQTLYDRLEKRIEREVHHMKDITINYYGNVLGYKYSQKRVK